MKRLIRRPSPAMVVAVIALVAGLSPTLLADAFFVAAWLTSGVLFRQASIESAPAR